jgi:hypothetical protein
MGLRFRKTFKLAPGIRMNLGSGGTSFNLGPRGASVSVGKRGVYANASSFGFSSRAKLSGSAPRVSRPPPAARPAPESMRLDVTVGVTDQGELYFKDPAGNPLPDAWVKVAKKQHADALKGLIQAKCDEINAQIEAVGELHLYAPAPDKKPQFVPKAFPEPQPVAPVPRRLDFLSRLFAFRRRRLEAENAELQRMHSEAVDAWGKAHAAYRELESVRRRAIEHQIYSDVDAMETHLEGTLQDVAWPRETLVAIEIQDGGRAIALDIDLPEAEDMPSTTAAVPARGLKLSVKEMSATQIQRLYMRHVHAIAFRMIGEAFAALPVSQSITVSGYSQRREKLTGQVKDEYLYSVRVPRAAWESIDFSEQGLAALDVVEALTRFDMRRTMSKTGVFKPITPHASETHAPA